MKPETGNSKPTYGFTVASYDKTKDLIIDPLLASTYLGGTGDEYGNFIVLDTGGNIYVTGTTWSIDFPTTSGAYDNSYNGDGGTFHERGGDVFVSKLDGGLTSLLVSTYLGGSNDDIGYSIAFDTSENVYVTGTTWSTDFPTTSGVYDDSFNGGRYRSDVFVSKLDSRLTTLQASTYLGGTDYEDIPLLTIDTSGNVYVTGRTGSADFSTTIGAYDTSHNSAYYWDVFVSKLDSELTNLLASTLLGGQSSEGGESLCLDTNGNVYVTGYTYSKDFPTTPGAYNTTRIDMIYSDVFVSKLNSELTNLLASTYLAGTNYDIAGDIFLATDGSVYLTGYTYSSDFPTTSGSYDTTKNDIFYSDAFVSRLDGELATLLASTYLGGYNWDFSHFLTSDTDGNVYVAGYTCSRDFPTTSGAYDTSLSGICDTFVSKLNGVLTNLLASTYLGGSSEDNCYSSALDTNGNVYVAGVTDSNNFPTTSSAYDDSFNGALDVFVSKLDGNLSATDECMAESITATPDKLTIKKNGNGNITITVKGVDDCLVEGVTVTATISGNGKRFIGISPDSQKTDANGQAVFSIKAKDKKGTVVIKFKAIGLNKFTIVQVKIR